MAERDGTVMPDKDEKDVITYFEENMATGRATGQVNMHHTGRANLIFRLEELYEKNAESFNTGYAMSTSGQIKELSPAQHVDRLAEMRKIIEDIAWLSGAGPKSRGTEEH